MKNLKFLGLALASTLTFTSCSSDDDAVDGGPDVDLNLTAQLSDEYVNSAALPQAILSYVSTNYPNNTISEAEIEDNNNFEVKLNDDTELIFNQAGDFLGIDDDQDDDFGDEDIATGDIPSNILDFLSTHFPTATIEEAELENNGNYEIELSTDEEIIFDADGEFLGRADDDDNDDSDDEDIEVSELSDVIRDYIATNYPTNTIIEAEREDDNTFEVTLNNGVELEFDAEGTFVSAEDQNGDDDDDDDTED